MRGKAYKAAKAKAPVDAVNVSDAVTFLKDNSGKKFDQTVEVHIHLGVDPEKADQMVRGSVTLPSGAPKQKKVVIIKNDAASEKIIAEIEKTGSLDADVVIATPDMMPKIAKVARILGPKGLMPNPKTGTVTPKPEDVVKELAGGKVSFKMDQLGNIHESVGKLSWEADKIVANVEALIAAVKALRPAGTKGNLLQKVVLKSTMSPSIRVTV
jgi:large subunit ribosomal protein L1